MFRLIEQRQGKIHRPIANIKISLRSPIGVFVICCDFIADREREDFANICTG